MCFVLYAGTSKPMPLREWRGEHPDLSVQALTERESPMVAHFTKPCVQYIGSTSCCGCDFPHVIFQNGDWPWFDDAEQGSERDESERYNREGLIKLIQATFEQTVELYGVWDGSFDFSTRPAVREEIALTTILDRSFRFKEQGFYVVRIG